MGWGVKEIERREGILLVYGVLSAAAAAAATAGGSIALPRGVVALASVRGDG